MSQLISHQVLVTGISRHPELSVQKGGRFSPIDFPISVVLLEMSSGYWLFDTGVGPQMQRLKSGVLSRLYPIVVPYRPSVDGSAAHQLRDRGIDPSDVERVVVSHFHADHIGGLRDFPNAEIVGHLDGLEQLFTERGVTAARKALFDVLLPDNVGARFTDVSRLSKAKVPWPGWSAVDAWSLSSDDSVIAVALPGHARGQFGLLLNGPQGTFHVADAAWISPAVERNLMPNPITRLVHDDWATYGATLGMLHDLSLRSADERPVIVPCHCARQHS